MNRTLTVDENGQRMTLGAMRKRFWKARELAGVTSQVRDLRAKASSDSDSVEDPRRRLAHADEATTAGYRRSRIGERAEPVIGHTNGIAEDVAESRRRRASSGS